MNAGIQNTMSDLHATHAARKSAGVGIRGGYSGGYSANVDPLDNLETVSDTQITHMPFDTHRPLQICENRHDVSERASWAFLMSRTIIVARPIASASVNEFLA